MKFLLLGGRLTVGLRTLNPPIGVRIPASQPIATNKAPGTFLAQETSSLQGYYLVSLPFSSEFRLPTRALYWDRGRPARRERAARTDYAELTSCREILAPDGGRSGRAARGPNEETRVVMRR